MQIIGRTNEIVLFNDILQSSSPEFIAVYGRRRVGKTFLIRNHFKNNIVFDCSGLNGQSQASQLENFRDSLTAGFPKKKKIDIPVTWLEAFNTLKESIGKTQSKKKKVIFLDELPWFETPRSGFKAALDNFWNNWCTKRNDIVLIICGSAASWIIKHIINDRGGLHNRVTRQLYLAPFSLTETKLFLENNKVFLTQYDILQLYMMVGGIPFYLKEIKPGKSLAQNIDRLFFQSKPVLNNEFENLYASLFKNYKWHTEIVKTLASKDRGMTREELVAATGLQSGGGFTTVMNELNESGFVSTHFPFKNIRKETIYRLSDEYSLFYFKFIHNSRKATGWMQKAGQQSFKIWCGHAFENFCLKHTGLIKKALGITGVYTQEASWLYKGNKYQQGTQIDLLIDRADNCINICEIKFYNSPFIITKTYADLLRHKAAIFQQQTKPGKNIFLTFISTFGTANNAYKLDAVANEIVMDDFFKD
ncbi:MAG: ATP-binding protein [Gloeobacteraceae cyanobacterium ES-bin-316]|nr:ATP-binding protein [Ferruginibacter sp.]